MKRIAALIRADMKPAFGVTEPSAIALASAKARRLTEEQPENLLVRLNSGVYKGAFTCGVPGTNETGCAFAAALGCIAGKPEKGLSSLEDVTETDITEALRLIAEHRVKVEVASISSDLFINVIVTTKHDICETVIAKSHDHFVKIRKNDQILLEEAAGKAAEMRKNEIVCYTLKELYTFAKTIPVDELAFEKKACETNVRLAESAVVSKKCEITKQLLRDNGGGLVSKDPVKTAEALTGAAIEARVLGLDFPAMTITGSGNHGIICVLPLYGLYCAKGLSEETLLRGIALSYSVTMYIKEYSGKLSAFCGCGIAGGIGMACGMALMEGATYEQVEFTLETLTASLVGMICHGGNHGCVMKALPAVQMAFRAVSMAMDGIRIRPENGICGHTAEETMQNIGRIASPGMEFTEKVILDILQEKAGYSE